MLGQNALNENIFKRNPNQNISYKDFQNIKPKIK